MNIPGMRQFYSTSYTRTPSHRVTPAPPPSPIVILSEIIYQAVHEYYCVFCRVSPQCTDSYSTLFIQKIGSDSREAVCVMSVAASQTSTLLLLSRVRCCRTFLPRYPRLAAGTIYYCSCASTWLRSCCVEYISHIAALEATGTNYHLCKPFASLVRTTQTNSYYLVSPKKNHSSYLYTRLYDGLAVRIRQ